MFFKLNIFAFVLMAFLVCAAICNKQSPNPVYNNDCMKNCAVTADYSPFCGSDHRNYPTRGMLGCFQRCNIQITKAYDGECHD